METLNQSAFIFVNFCHPTHICHYYPIGLRGYSLQSTVHHCHSSSALASSLWSNIGEYFPFMVRHELYSLNDSPSRKTWLHRVLVNRFEACCRLLYKAPLASRKLLEWKQAIKHRWRLISIMPIPPGFSKEKNWSSGATEAMFLMRRHMGWPFTASLLDSAVFSKAF